MIQRVAVLGAGVMGSQIAAHIVNSGLPVILLDLSRDIVERAIRSLQKLSPPALFVNENIRHIEIGTFDEDISRLKDVDWILEAVIEDVDIKRKLFDRIEPNLGAGAIVTTNTSGLSVTSLAEGRSDDFRGRFFGTHFFNPPRYLRLLEIIPTPWTHQNTIREFEVFVGRIMGKGVVRAKDTPNFIANRIGLQAALKAIELMERYRLTIEEVDYLTGPLIGRPKTATFRTLDIVGLDVIQRVAANSGERLPTFMESMVSKGMLGKKTNGGFYRKDGDAILTVDTETLEYRPQQKPRFPELDATIAIESLPHRLRALLQVKAAPAQYVSELLQSTTRYAASLVPEIADSPEDVDRAMRWGFGWDLGPFELATVLDSRQPAPPSHHWIHSLPAIHQNPGATLRDLGDDVACLEFHSKLNTIGGDIISMLMSSLDEVNRNFKGLIIGNQGVHFSAGANLMLLMMEAVEGNWDEIDFMVRTFQRATQAIKYNPRPVVVAPFGLTLGGGCEVALASAHVQAAAETYMGLVELGAGLIPAAGGTTEMLLRASRTGPATARDVFSNIATAKVSTSAEEARRLLYLRASDRITMNTDRLLHDAKSEVLLLFNEGYRPPMPSELPVYGRSLEAELKLGIYLLEQAGRISEYDAHLGRTLARVFCGGDSSHSSESEQHFLDLEREAFLSLCGQPKTLARIEHLLKRGKPLRN